MPLVKYSKVLLIVLVVSSFVNNLDCSVNVGNVLDVSWRLPEPEGVSNSSCEEDLRDLHIGLRNMTLWAIEMWDSSARGPSGLLQGSLYQLGNFGECLKEEETVAMPGPPRQYCLVKVTLHSPEQEKQYAAFVENFDPFGSADQKLYYSGDHVRLKRNVIHWGVCAPASCGAAELEGLLRLHFREQALAWNRTDPEYRVSVGSSSCQKPGEQKPFTTGALLFFWIMGISIGFVLLASSYHWYLIGCARDKEIECPSIVKAYSLIYHLSQLGKKKSDELDVLWGLRFLSICFIILDHRYVMAILGPVSNRENLEEKYHTFTSIFICHSDLLVDSFFVLSGLLSSYGLLKMNQNASLNVPLLILYRYIRLAPAYAVMVFFTAQILPLTGSGPLWSVIMEPEAECCRQNWWTNLLMLSNYINISKMCMVHSWYVPCDFHYFLVSLAICALFRIRSSVLPALVVLAVLLLASVLVPAFVTYALKLPGTLLFLEDFMTNPREHRVFRTTYIGSHNRAGPYLLGMLTGYLIVKKYKPENKKISAPLSIIGAVVSLVVMLGAMASGAIFYEPSRPYSVVEAAFYAALHRPVWAAALCLLILCCVFGHIPIISVLLSWSPWATLGKLVYGAYLVHISLQLRSAALTRQPYHIDPTVILGQALGDMVMSFSAALLLYVIVEGPIRQIVNIIVFRGKKKTKAVPVIEKTYSQTGHNNEALNAVPETQAVPTLNKAIRDNSIMEMFAKKDNNIQGNKNNVTVEMDKGDID